MERRRSLRLQEKEIEKKKAKMDSITPPEAVEPIVQNSAIFDSKILDVLPNIINNLDPDSFVKLARTCKDMNHICFNNNNRIRIPCWHSDSVIRDAGVILIQNGANCFLHVNKGSYSGDSQFVKKLAKFPFVYEVDLFSFEAINERILGCLRNFFSNIPHIVIRRLEAPVDDWEGFVEFMKNYRIGALHIFGQFVDGELVGAPLEIQLFLTQNVSEFICYFNVPDDVILRATTKIMQLYHANISKETFKELIKKYAAGDIDRFWSGRERAIEHDDESDDDENNDDDENHDDEDDVEDEEVNEDQPDPFIAVVSEVMKVVEVEDIDRNAMEPSTAYFKPSEPEEFFILKSDGSLGTFSIWRSEVSIGNQDL